MTNKSSTQTNLVASTIFTDSLRSGLATVRLLPRRMLFDTAEANATIPMVRGVWGAALHDLDADVYRTVFRPQESSPEDASPAYVFRPAPPDPAFAPAIDWISIGPALPLDTTLLRAWDIASGMGLGPTRQRFHIRKVAFLRPDGSYVADTQVPPMAERYAWPLSDATWPFAEPETNPCRLGFPAPLRLRRKGRLLDQPTLSDLVVAATRRVRAYLQPNTHHDWDLLSRNALEISRTIRCSLWQGMRFDLRRYSASQHADLDLQGVAGWLELPDGPGPLWPLLAAAQWLHLGKSTILGLGQLQVTQNHH